MASFKDLEISANAEDTYVAQWKAFARRQHLALFLLYGSIPLCFALFLLSRHWFYQLEISLAVICSWLVGIAAAVWWAGEFRCPRCSRRYASLGRGRSVSLTRGIFDRACSNCKLAKFER